MNINHFVNLFIHADVTALADRDNVGRDRDGNKNAVTKTYHTLKDLISSKFKKDSNEGADELNNVVIHQPVMGKSPMDELMTPHPAVPLHMRQMQNLNQVEYDKLFQLILRIITN